MAKEYTSKGGRTLIKPSFDEARQCDDDGCGWCLACGFDGTPAEPDARRYACEECGEKKVFGAAELILMGLVH